MKGNRSWSTFPFRTAAVLVLSIAGMFSAGVLPWPRSELIATAVFPLLTAFTAASASVVAKLLVPQNTKKRYGFCIAVAAATAALIVSVPFQLVVGEDREAVIVTIIATLVTLAVSLLLEVESEKISRAD